MSDDPTRADDILTVKEAAVILGKTIHATRQLLQRGTLRGRRLGRPAAWVTTRQEVTEYMAWARTHKHHDRRHGRTGDLLPLP